MKTSPKLALLLGAFALLPLAQSKAAELSVSFFYDNLDSYGEWVEVGDYGYCWHPREVNDDWRPYNDGNWVYTDAGWTWVSDEPYGWAVYHYGRWTRTERVGWVWVPDTEWAPAWVSWRRNDRYVGWAPLPPESRGRIGVSIGGWVDAEFDIGPTYYSFVEVRNLGAPRLRSVVLPPRENLTIINQTTNITNITYQNNVVINNGPDYNVVSRQVDQPIRRLKLERRAEIADLRGARAEQLGSKVRGESLVVAAPAIQKAADAKPKKVAQKLEKTDIDRGWKNAGDPKQVETARAKIKDEAKGGPGKTAQETAPTAQPDKTTAEPKRGSPPTAQESTTPPVDDQATKPGKGKGRDRKVTAGESPTPTTAPTAGETPSATDRTAPGKVGVPDDRGIARESDQSGGGKKQRGKKGERSGTPAENPEAVAEKPTPSERQTETEAKRPGKQEQPERSDKKSKPQGSETPEQPERATSDRPQPPEREKIRANRPNQPAEPKAQRPGERERVERPERAERPEQPDRPERAARPDRPEQAERPNRERPPGQGPGVGRAERANPEQRPERAQPQAPQNRPPQPEAQGRGPGAGKGRGAEEKDKKKDAPENQ